MSGDKFKGGMAAFLIGGLVVGGIGGYALAGNMSSESAARTSNQDSGQMQAGTDTPAAGLRVSLNNALREHVSLAGVALRNVFDGSKDTQASVDALDKNSVEVAGLVGSVYGDQAEQDFLELWRQHIGFFADYTTAAKNGDMAGMAQAQKDLEGYAEASSNFFASANPNLPKDAVKPLLVEHRNVVIAVVDSYGAGDYGLSYEKETEAIEQVSSIADALASGIAQQYPDKF